MLDYGEKNANSEQVRDGLIHIGLAFDFQNQFDSAKYYYKKSERYSRLNSDSLGIAKSLLNIGVVFYFQGVLDSAINYYELSRPIFEQLNEQKFLSYNLNNLAQIYKKVGNHQKAIEAYLSSLKIKEAQQDSLGLNNAYLNLSSAYLAIGDYQNSHFYASDALDLAKARKAKNYIASALVNIGQTYKGQNEHDKALTSFLEAEEYIDKTTGEDWLINLYFHLAELFRDKGNIKKASRYLNKMEAMLESESFLEEQVACYKLGHELSKSDGQTKKALQYLEKYVEVKEKYLSESVQETVNDLEKKYETELKEKKITLLELNNKEAEIALISSKNQRTLFVLAAVVLLIVTVFLYMLFSQKRSSLAQREILLKEIHHRVKNNLQIISSLLNQQSRYTDDESVIEAVKESRNRVKSMAMIHQKLYQEDNLTGVSISDYIGNLTESLFTSYGVDHEQINLEMDIDNLNLDIDTIIPMGLILNELISNALKYAFPDNQNGELLISLKQAQDNLILLIEDDGVGIGEDYDLKKSKSFGLKLVNSLCRKLNASIVIDNSNGTSISLQISDYKLA
jgi:two-component sensor histidine kinase